MKSLKPHPSPHKLIAILIVLLFGLVGSYLLAASYAYVDPSYSFSPLGQILATKGDTAKGETITFDIEGGFYLSDTYTSAVYININSDKSRVKYLGISDCRPYVCNPVDWNGQISSGQTLKFFPTDQTICLNIPAGKHAWSPEDGRFHMEHVFTLKYRAYDAIRANDQNWLALVTQYQVGHTCKNTIDDGIWFAGISGWGYSCGYANLAPCNGKTPNPGTGGGGGGDNRGTGDQGEGSGGDGSGVGTASSTGSGGGGGSSTAKNQSDKSKPLPKASAQGNAEQPELEPSPFFDGRQYKPGSEPDNLIISTISNASQTMIRNWPLALGTIVVVSPAGYFIWRRWK